MNIRRFIILASILIGLSLAVAGAIVAINSFLNPQGNLFEGAVLFSLGVITFLLVILGSAIGNLITVYSEVLQKQITIQKEMHEEFARRNNATGTALNSFFSGMMPENMTITGSVGKPVDNDVYSTNKKDFQDMTILELEKELAKALNEEDFEKATEINKAIKQLKNPDNPES